MLLKFHQIKKNNPMKKKCKIKLLCQRRSCRSVQNDNGLTTGISFNNILIIEENWDVRHSRIIRVRGTIILFQKPKPMKTKIPKKFFSLLIMFIILYFHTQYWYNLPM